MKNAKKYLLIKQILIILTIIMAFLTAACIAKRDTLYERLFVYLFISVIDVVLIVSWSWLFLSMREERDYEISYLQKIYSNRGLIISLSYCFITRFIQIEDTPKWDSLTYYGELARGCREFNFSFSQFWNGFSLAGHPTRGYMSLLAIGEFLWSGQYIGVILANLVIALIAVFCVYRILEKVIPKCGWLYYTCATCLVFSTPLFLGTFSYLQPDAGLVYAFVYLLYCYLYQRNLLMVFSMLLLLQTKEVGILMTGGFLLGIFIHRILRGREKEILQRVYGFFREPIGKIGLIGGILGTIYFIILLKKGFQAWSYGKDVSPYMSTFSFQPEFIVFKLKQFFLLNFNWLIWGGNLFFSIIILVKKKRKTRSAYIRGTVLGAVYAVSIIVMIFYSLYITFVLPRYQVILDFCGGLIFVILLRVAIPKRRARYIITVMVGMCVLVQAYVTIDPVSLAAFKHQSTGNGNIISENLRNGDVQRDYCVYNHQFNYLNKAYDYVLRDVGYNEGMDVWVWSNDTNTQIWPAGIYWNLDLEKRTIMAGENAISIRGFARQDEEVSTELELNPEAVFILVQQMNISEEFAEDFLNSYYEIRYRGEVNVPLGGKVIYYVCDLIGEKVIQK